MKYLNIILCAEHRNGKNKNTFKLQKGKLFKINITAKNNFYGNESLAICIMIISPVGLNRLLL